MENQNPQPHQKKRLNNQINRLAVDYGNQLKDAHASDNLHEALGGVELMKYLFQPLQEVQLSDAAQQAYYNLVDSAIARLQIAELQYQKMLLPDDNPSAGSVPAGNDVG